MGTFFKRKSRWILCMLLCISTGYLSAQHQNYHLSELVDAAKNHLPVLLQKQALINSAKASYREVKHSFLPQVKVSDQVNIGTDNSLAGSYLPISIAPSSSAGVRADNIYEPVTGNIGALYGEYALINFGLNKARLRNAGAYVDLQQSDLDQELYNIQASIARDYFNMLKTQYRLLADKQNVDRYDSIFKVIRALSHSGIKPGSDSSLAKAELSKARITYNQTLGSLNQLKDQLSYLSGLPAADLIINSPANDAISQQLPLINFAEDTIHNPLIDYYVKRNNIFLSEQAVIKKSYLPKVLLGAGTWIRGSGIQYNDDYKSLATGLGYQRFNYMAGIGITYNLFSGLYKKDRLAVNSFQLQAGGYELQQQKLALAVSAEQADDALKINDANLLELPVQLKAAEDTYRQKIAQYKAGIISLIDLTNASFVLYRSQTDFIETKNDWWLSQLDKATATGNLINFIQLIK